LSEDRRYGVGFLLWEAKAKTNGIVGRRRKRGKRRGKRHCVESGSRMGREGM